MVAAGKEREGEEEDLDSMKNSRILTFSMIQGLMMRKMIFSKAGSS